MQAIQTIFTNLLNVGTGVGVTVAAFFLMIGAYQYMSAGGNPHRMEEGKTAMINAAVGLAVVLLARVLAEQLAGAIGSG
jgi:hypothetical protein